MQGTMYKSITHSPKRNHSTIFLAYVTVRLLKMASSKAARSAADEAY